MRKPRSIFVRCALMAVLLIGVVVAGIAVYAIVSRTDENQQSMLASFFSLPGLIFWIIYWVQINNHKNRVKNLPGEQGKSQIFDS